MIVIIDYGMGNSGSILNRLKRLEVEAEISQEVSVIKKADKLILPGVGYFAAGMESLKKSGLVGILEERVLGDKVPILGICLGMQLFTRWSEEGDVDGLGWLDAVTEGFDFKESGQNLRVPHIGWESISKKKESPLLEGVADDAAFYFVHSYHLRSDRPDEVLATTRYGYDFVSIVSKDNIYGTQFHPEKSHKAGISVLQNFAERI